MEEELQVCDPGLLRYDTLLLQDVYKIATTRPDKRMHSNSIRTRTFSTFSLRSGTHAQPPIATIPQYLHSKPLKTCLR